MLTNDNLKTFARKGIYVLVQRQENVSRKEVKIMSVHKR